jgi:hypothetical protein
MYNRWRHWFLRQDSEEWSKLHEEGAKVLTASVFPDLVGYGYQSVRKRFELALGLSKKKTNEYRDALLEYGKENEVLAIKDFYKSHPQFKGQIQPGIVWSAELPFVGASVDNLAWLGSDIYPVEVKCPCSQVLPEPKDRLGWLIQVQIQLYCLGPEAERGILYFWQDGFGRAYWVPRSPQLIDLLLCHGVWFFNNVAQRNESAYKGRNYKDKRIQNALAELLTEIKPIPQVETF